MDNERRKQVEDTIKGLNKSAKEKLFNFADTSPDKEVITFDVPMIDDFIGGGVVKRKYTVDFGGEDTGKSTRALHLVANAQKQGLACAYFDMERKFDKERARSLGVKLEDLLITQKLKTAEEAMDAIKLLAEQKIVDLVIVDSIQAMSPKGEQETKKGKKKSIENDEMALLARKLGKFFRTTSADVFRANMAVYLIGQVRMNIGGFFAFADLSGGNALKHWMSMCIYSRKGQKSNAPIRKEKENWVDPDGKERKRTVNIPIGFECVIKMVKSHVTGSAREGEDISLPFYYETGFKEPKDRDPRDVIEVEEEHVQTIQTSGIISEPKKKSTKKEVVKPKARRGRPKKEKK